MSFLSFLDCKCFVQNHCAKLFLRFVVTCLNNLSLILRPITCCHLVVSLRNKESLQFNVLALLCRSYRKMEGKKGREVDDWRKVHNLRKQPTWCPQFPTRHDQLDWVVTRHQYGIFALAENVGYAKAKSFAYINRMPTLAHPSHSLGHRLD